MNFDGLLKGLSSPMGSFGLGLLANSRDQYGNFAPTGQVLGSALNDVYLQQQAQALYERQQQALQQQQAQQQWMAQNMPGLANAPAMVQQEAIKARFAQPAQPPEMIQQYNFARQQGYQGSYMDFLKQKSAPLVVNNMGGQIRTPAQEKLDEEVAKSLAPYATGQGYDSDKMIAQLEAVRARLAGSDNLTGPVVGNIPMRDVFAPASMDVQQQVEEVVQRNLRQILGAQFTEKEGDRLIARAYNPKLEESVNLERVDRLIAQIKAAHQAKQSALNHLQQYGSLDGWQGKMPAYEDFLRAIDGQTSQETRQQTLQDQAKAELERRRASRGR